MAKTNDSNTISTNMITNGTKITGDITCDSDIRLEGELEGNLTAKGKVVIGNSGVVKGEITCENCDVEGALTGKITTHELLSLRETANLNGDIYTKKLAIEPGALFSGTCSMENKSQNSASDNESAKTQESDKEKK
ncbi:MAG: polymer-forming cytoskeletal protein [Bacteroidales bacterium]